MQEHARADLVLKKVTTHFMPWEGKHAEGHGGVGKYPAEEDGRVRYKTLSRPVSAARCSWHGIILGGRDKRG